MDERDCKAMNKQETCTEPTEPIERALYPGSGILRIEEGIATAQIVDAELDGIDCVFAEGVVQLIVEPFNSIALSRNNLLELLRLLDEAEEIEEDEDEPVYENEGEYIIRTLRSALYGEEKSSD